MADAVTDVFAADEQQLAGMKALFFKENIRINEEKAAIEHEKERMAKENELFEKKLFFLIPFHIFVYEKDFKELEENKKKLKQLEEEYAAIRERLEIACQKKQLRSWHGRRISQNADTQIFLLQSKKFQYTFTKINVYWNCIY